MIHEKLICAIYVIINIYHAESCISKKVEIYKGKIYYIGLFSVNITENHPDIRNSEAYLNHVRLTSNAYYSHTRSELVPHAYTAYEICDSQYFLIHVLLSLLLDEEFNLPDGTLNGNSSRIATIIPHLSMTLTKLLVTYFSFEDIPIVSQLLENQIFNNNKELIPFYYPARKDHAATNIMNIVKTYSSNHVVVACLTNEKYFEKICNEVIDNLSNEMTSCFWVTKVYSKHYLDRLVNEIDVQNKNKTTFVVIGNGGDQLTLLNEMSKNNISNRNIISYGFSYEYIIRNGLLITNNLANDLKILLLFIMDKFRYQEKNTNDSFSNTAYMHISSGEIMDYPDGLDTRYLMLQSDSTISTSFELIKYAKHMIKRWILILNYIYLTVTDIHDAFCPCYTNYIDESTIYLHNGKFHIEQLKALKCDKKLCNSSYEAILIKKSYGIWSYTQEWICQQCQENFIQAIDNTNASCVKCHKYFISNANNTKCLDPYIEKYLSLQNKYVYIPISIVIISIMMVLTTVAVFIKFSKHNEIKASNKTMTIVQIATFLLFFIVFPILMITRPSNIKCHVRPMLFGFAFNVVSSILLAKTTKLLKIFNADIRFTKSEIRNSKIVDIMIIFAFIIFESALNFICIVKIPPKVAQQFKIESKEKLIFCNNNQHFIIHIIVSFIIFFVSIVQCFRIRNLPSLFNEAKEILNATLMADFILALTLLLYYSRSTEYERDYVILLMLSIMAGSFYLFLFYEKMMLIVRYQWANSSNAGSQTKKRSTDLQI